MSDTLITCPSCKTGFPLTESLAAPLVESMRVQYAERFAQRESEMKRREATILKDCESLDEQVAARYGHLQGVACRRMQEIKGLEFPTLELGGPNYNGRDGA